MNMENSLGKKLRTLLTFILIFLYTGSVLSVFLTHTAHEVHHLITHTMHLHHEHHQLHETNNQLQNHGHEHGDFIDTALQNATKDDMNSDQHTLAIICLFDHLNVLSPLENMSIPDNDVQWIQNNLSLFTQYTPDPPSPPPKYLNA